MKHVYFVRHGESTSNRDKVRYGAEAPLTELGQRQASAVAKRFKTIPIELVLASPFKRAHDTGKAIAELAGAPFEVVDLAKERSLPKEVEGKKRSDPEAVRIVDEVTQGWLTGNIKHPTAEDFSEMLARVDALQQLIQERPEEHIALASHQLFGKIFLQRVLLGTLLTPELSYAMHARLKAANTGIHHYTVSDDGSWRLVSWNDDAHLGSLYSHL